MNARNHKHRFIHLIIYMLLFGSVSKYFRLISNIKPHTQTDVAIMFLLVAVLFVGSVLILKEFSEETPKEKAN